MKIAKLIHNPSAGDEDHSKRELISIIESFGFECRYSSSKSESWKDIEPEIDFLIAAGGDGTVRKITKELLNRKVLEKTWPIALLPLGTANNIARTLEISGTFEQIIQSWHDPEIKRYDVGIFTDEKGSDFFVEGFGYGIFPYLMLKMKDQDKSSINTPELETETALRLLHEITLSYEPRYCHLEVDGVNHSGKFMLAEVMNIRYIGSSLLLSPHSDPGDGELEIVLLPEKHKDRLASYVVGKIEGVEEQNFFQAYQGKNIHIAWEGTHIHLDDKIVKRKRSTEVNIDVRPELLEFLVPKKK